MQCKRNNNKKNPPPSCGGKRAENCSSCSRINLTFLKLIQAELFPPLESCRRDVLSQCLFSVTYLAWVTPRAPAPRKHLQDDQACWAPAHLVMMLPWSPWQLKEVGAPRDPYPTHLRPLLQKELGHVPSAFGFISILQVQLGTGDPSNGDPNILLDESLSPYFLTRSAQSSGIRLMQTALGLFLCARRFNPSLARYRNVFTSFIQTFNS